MAERSIITRLRADVSGFVSGMRTAQQATQDFVGKGLDKIDKHSASIDSLSNKAGLAGLALTGFATAGVMAFANFDEAMSNVQASTMETADNMNLLRDAAIDAGARTQYSATEAAGAIEELAKAGVSTADILAGGLDGALDLAASGGMEVAAAAEVAASAMTQFGLSGGDVTHIADLLAAGAGKAQGSVHDMGMALNQSGLVANQMGLSLEETVGTLTAFASAGMVGSDAGTSFRSMLLHLANPSNQAAEAMADLGLQAYDAAGQFVGMESLSAQLQTSLSGVDQATRDAAMATIFGSDAIRASAILYEQGAEGVAQWTAAVDEQGFAAEQATIRMDNLKGDLEELGGAFETAMIGMGEGGDGAMRGIVQGATSAVNAFGELPPAAQQATLAIAGGGGLALLGIAGMGKLVTSVAEVRTSLQGLGISAKTAGIAVGGVGAALAVATFAVTSWATAQAEARAHVDSLRDSFEEVSGAITDVSRELIAEGFLEVENWANRIGYGFDSAADAAQALGIDLGTLTEAALGDAQALAEVNATLDEWRASGEHTDAILLVSRRLEEQRDAVGAARDEHSQMQEAVGASADEQDNLAGSTRTVTEALDAQVASLAEVIELQRDLAGVVLSERDAQRGFQEAIAAANEALAENGATLDITTEKGRANQAALDDIADSGWDVIESMTANGATQEALQGTMAGVREQFLQAATAMGMGSEEALALADSLGLVPENVTVHVEAETTSAQEALAAVIAAIEAGEGSVDINGNPTPVGDVLLAVRAEIGNTDGEVTIGGDEQSAIQTLDAVLAAIRDGDEEVTIGGEKYPAEQATAELLAWIAQQNTNVNVGVNDSAVTTWTPPSWYTYLDVRVRMNAASNVPGTMVRPEADGGVLDFYADGGLRENHVAQIAPAGAWRVWAEPETGGEAYIPLAPAKRERSLAIWEETGRRLGALEAFASGGFSAGTAASVRGGRASSLSIAAAFELDFTDLLGAYDEVIEKNRELAEEAAAATESTEDSWEDFIGRFPTTTADLIRSFEDQIRAHQEWERNMAGLSGRVSGTFFDALGEMGEAGQDLVAQLAASSAGQLAVIDRHFRTLQQVQEATARNARIQGYIDEIQAVADATDIFAEVTSDFSDRVSGTFMDALRDMGDEGLEMALDLRHATDAQLSFIDSLYQEAAAQEAAREAQEALTRARQEFIDATADAFAGMVDRYGFDWGIPDDFTSQMELADRMVEQLGGTWAEHFSNIRAGSVSTMDLYLADLEAQVAAQQAWKDNLLTLSGRVSEEVLADLAAMGERGAPMIAGLVGATDEQLARMEELFAASGLDAGTGFAEALAAEVGAAEGMVQAQVSGWDLTATVAVSAVPVSGLSGFYSGGYTGDLPTNAVAGVTHGREFVTNAAATARWRPQLEDMNAGRTPRLQPAQAAGPVVLAEESVRQIVAGFLDGSRAVGRETARQNLQYARQGVSR